MCPRMHGVQGMLDRLKSWLRPTDAIAPVAIDLRRVDEACGIDEGFVRCNWEDIGAYVEGTFEVSDQPGAWTAASRRWLELAAESFGPPYRVVEGKRTLVLSGWDHPFGMVKLGDEILREWHGMLKDISRPVWKGKVPVLMLDHRETYHDYIAPYYPEEGEFLLSAGVFLHTTMPHVALFSCEANQSMSTLVHELTHGCLARLDLPRWMDEGFAQVAEGAAGSVFNPDRYEVERHARYWRKHSLEDFWNGESFGRPKSGAASYFLAQVIVRNILSARKRDVPALLKTVRSADGGAAGVREVLGMELEDLVAGLMAQAEPERAGADEDEDWK